MAENHSSRASMEKLLDDEKLDVPKSTQDQFHNHHHNYSETKRLTILLAISVFLNFTVLILVAVSLFLPSHRAGLVDNPDDILHWTSFTEDLDFQSLDQKFDKEWMKGSVTTEGIIQDTDGRLGGIAM